MTEHSIDTDIPRITGTLRAHAIETPKSIRDARGMAIMGRRVKSVVYTTDLAIIRNCDADAVMAVYPFTPQQVISQAIISASPMPVFCGVGGGTTKGMRSVIMAQDVEAQGAYGAVVNSPISNSTIRLMKSVIDIPIIATVVTEEEDIQARIDAGASIINVAAGKRTAEAVARIREQFPSLPIMASGGRTEESIRDTIAAGANTIVFTPPSNSEIFSKMMDEYRTMKTKNPEYDLGASLRGRGDQLKSLIKLLGKEN